MNKFLLKLDYLKTVVIDICLCEIHFYSDSGLNETISFNTYKQMLPSIKYIIKYLNTHVGCFDLVLLEDYPF